MIAEHIEHIYTEAEKEFLLRIITTKIAPILEDLAKGGLAYAWESWKNEVKTQRAAEAQKKLLVDVKEVMCTSTRGQRTAAEKELIIQYVSKLSCIPSDTSHTAMDSLCNEIDFYPAIDAKSVMFLQGDFGNCYYIIAEGKVDLYLEQSKDKEMENGHTFGKHRGISYNGSDFANDLLKEVDENGKPPMKTSTFLSAAMGVSTNESDGMEVSPVGTRSELGRKIVTLEAGRGFGEFAILSTAGKIRMCSAVAATSNSFCFILHASTYNLVLKQHHYRASKLSAATALLKQMPVFNTYSHAKLSSIAFNMKSTFHQKTSVVVHAGDNIDRVLIVHTGTIRVLKEREIPQPADYDSDDPPEPGEAVHYRSAEETLLRRLPRLAVSELGKGSVVGEWELLKGLETFSTTYISSSNDCEVFEMPLSVYQECCTSTTISEHQQDLMREKLVLAQRRDTKIKGRLDRTEDKIKKIALEFAKDKDDQTTLLRMLPLLIDGVTLEGGVAIAADAGRSGGGDKGFKHRYKSSQDFISLNREIRAEAGLGATDATEVMGGDLDMAGGDVETTFGYDPSASQNLEKAYRALPRTPSPARGAGHFGQSGGGGGARGVSRDSRRAPGSRGSRYPRGSTPRGYHNPGSPTAALNLTLVNQGGSPGPGSPLIHRAMSPPDSARSRPSPRASRVLSASSYRD